MANNRQQFNQVLEISSSINLTGKISCLVHFVLVCNATNGSITVTLPDSNSVKNICIVGSKTDSSENSVRFVCKRPDQRINSKTAANLLYQNDSIMLFPKKNGYVIGSINQTI
jgi:hypothetical protein